jgi:hypothetical protein
MRSVTLLLTAALVAIASVAIVRACEGAGEVRLSNAGIEGLAVPLNKLAEGETVRACVEVGAGRRIDWYFTTAAAASTWQTNEINYYVTGGTPTTPYSVAPSPVYYSQLATTGFTQEFEVTAAQVAEAGGDFAVVIHSTSDCLGTGNECVVQTSVLKITKASIVVIIIIVCVGVALLIAIGACVYCCCCRNKNPEAGAAQPAAGVVVVQPEQQQGGYPQQQGQPEPEKQV